MSYILNSHFKNLLGIMLIHFLVNTFKKNNLTKIKSTLSVLISLN